MPSVESMIFAPLPWKSLGSRDLPPLTVGAFASSSAAYTARSRGSACTEHVGTTFDPFGV